MKKHLFTLFLMGCMAIPLLCSCRVINPSSTSFFTYQTECVNVELDGSQTLKAYGMGRNWIDAATQARKNALRDVIFKGISSGSKECQAKPILLEVNAEEKYRSYFNDFFLDRGPIRNVGHFSQFVSLRDERFVQRITRQPGSQNADQDVYSVIVRVYREQLRQQLIKDGILRQY